MALLLPFAALTTALAACGGGGDDRRAVATTAPATTTAPAVIARPSVAVLGAGRSHRFALPTEAMERRVRYPDPKA